MAMTNVMKKAAIKTAYSYLEKNPEENMLKLMDWVDTFAGENLFPEYREVFRSALSDPDKMEEILENGQADLIAMGRALVADPDLPNKVRDGRIDEIRRCLRCYSCQGQMMKTRNILCTVNPVIGQEYDAKYRLPAAHKHKVAVIGGGPGGMQAAITCAVTQATSKPFSAK